MVAIALVMGVSVLVITLRRPLPTTSGTVTVGVVDSPAWISRDANGVPHVSGATDADLFRAQGYAHAQDRYFDMDSRRRIASGTAAEVYGPSAVESDIAARTIGFRHVAELQWEGLDPETKRFYSAYAEGVNAYLEGREPGSLALEYTVAGFDSEPVIVTEWDPVDSLTILMMAAWDYDSSIDREITRASAYRPLFGDLEAIELLYPDYPSSHPPVIHEDDLVSEVRSFSGIGGRSRGLMTTTPTIPREVHETASAEPGERERLASERHEPTHAPLRVDAMPSLMGNSEAVGSSAVVIAGKHTADGTPVLAGDSHVALRSPSIWVPTALRCVAFSDDCTFNVSGMTLPGVPGVLIGRNPNVAWTVTSLGADTTDLVLEAVNDDGTYVRGDGVLELTERTETITVHGEDDVVITIQSTDVGPIVSDALHVSSALTIDLPEGSPSRASATYEVALAWTGLHGGSGAEAYIELARAATVEDVVLASEALTTPALGLTYATVDGDIGFQATGLIPVRKQVEDSLQPADGTWPWPAWDSAYGWSGYVPNAKMPATVNPESGYIVAANQQVTEANTPFLGADWDPGYRAARLDKLISGDIKDGRPVDIMRAAEYLVDDRSALGPMIMRHLPLHSRDPYIAEATETLREWETNGFPTNVHDPGATYAYVLYRQLLVSTFDDDLPNSVRVDGSDRWIAVMEGLMDEPRHQLWDDRTTVNVVESRDSITESVVLSARQELTSSIAKNPAEWSWGKLHRAQPPHNSTQFHSTNRHMWEKHVFDFPEAAVPGGPGAVNATGFDATVRGPQGRGNYNVVIAPAVRFSLSLGQPDGGRWVIAGGTSSHPASSHFEDQWGVWLDGKMVAWPTSSSAVAAGADVLELR